MYQNGGVHLSLPPHAVALSHVTPSASSCSSPRGGTPHSLEKVWPWFSSAAVGLWAAWSWSLPSFSHQPDKSSCTPAYILSDILRKSDKSPLAVQLRVNQCFSIKSTAGSSNFHHPQVCSNTLDYVSFDNYATLKRQFRFKKCELFTLYCSMEWNSSLEWMKELSLL